MWLHLNQSNYDRFIDSHISGDIDDMSDIEELKGLIREGDTKDICYIKPCGNWYVMHTTTGKEEQLIEALYHMVRKQVADNRKCCPYRACFSLTYEDVWRYQGRSYIDIKKMFPGYLFLVTDNPEYMNDLIKKIPQYVCIMSEIIDEGKTIISMSKAEAEYIYSLLCENDYGDYCVHRSFVIRNNNKIVEAYGALEKHIADIVQADYKKRRVIVEKHMLGQTRRIKFCIYDDTDCHTEGITSPIEIDENEEEKDFPFRVGDRIWLDLEGHEDEPYTITRLQMKKKKVYVAVEMFGREVEMEVGVENIV